MISFGLGDDVGGDTSVYMVIQAYDISFREFGVNTYTLPVTECFVTDGHVVQFGQLIVEIKSGIGIKVYFQFFYRESQAVVETEGVGTVGIHRPQVLSSGSQTYIIQNIDAGIRKKYTVDDFVLNIFEGKVCGQRTSALPVYRFVL